MTVMQGLHLGRGRKSGNLRRFIERLCGGVCYNGVIFSLWGPSVGTARQEAITVALDKAIAATAERELQRLIQDRDPIEIAKKICGALRGLEKLQSGEMPEYDEWVALFYLLWYQPGAHKPCLHPGQENTGTGQGRHAGIERAGGIRFWLRRIGDAVRVGTEYGGRFGSGQAPPVACGYIIGHQPAHAHAWTDVMG